MSADGHNQEEPGAEVGLENGPSVAGPIGVLVEREGFTGAARDDLEEQGVELALGQEASQGGDDLLRPGLKIEGLEAVTGSSWP